ncbi:MFS transporter [Arthrobacter sp. 35W]|uniref:MFS transporter n=1 Tax=Arthrobacter sp. 35W TaxID=1132441 RepID=UPI0004021D8A|nr:MFS transporter [Arthrobacter sp. 35W]
MNFSRYREVLGQWPVLRLILVAMVARIPHAAAGVVLTLHVVNTMDLGYGAAGGVAAAVTVGMALGAPWRGRQVDVVGLRRALIPSVIAEVVVWSAAPFLNYQLLLLAAAVGGAFAVPIFSVVRQALGVMVATKDRRVAYSLDSIGAEITFMIGPAAGVLLATSIDTRAGLILVGAASALAGVALMWFNPPTRTGQPGAVPQDESSAWGDADGGTAREVDSYEELAPVEAMAGQSSASGSYLGRVVHKARSNFGWVTVAVLAVLGASVGAGLVLSGTNVGMVALLNLHERIDDIGLVFVFWCGASVLGGIIYGALHRPVSPLILLAAMALLTIPMGFATDAWTLGLLSIAPGLLCAPVLTSSAEQVAALVEEKRRGEAMGWYGSAMTLGSAAGSPLAGFMIDSIGPWAGFTFIGALATVLAIVGLVLKGIRRRAAEVPVA